MVDLILLGMFTAFFLVSLEEAIDFLSIFVNGKVISIILSLVISTIGTYLLSTHSWKQFVLKLVAGAFLGSFLVALGQRLATYRVSPVNQIK
jgi:hypothetical protein